VVRRRDLLVASLDQHHTRRRSKIVAALLALGSIAVWITLIAPAVVGLGMAVVGAMAWCFWQDRQSQTSENTGRWPRDGSRHDPIAGGKITGACEDSLRALRDALATRGYTATR
jgi:hypothetical protein